MAREPGFGGSFHFLARGDFKGLVLSVLQDRPMHGYEIMKLLEERYQGFYRPSAGAIYPALRSLLAAKYVTVDGRDRRKVYRITPAGKEYLADCHAKIEERFKTFAASIGPDRAALLKELRATSRLIWSGWNEMTPAKAKHLRGVLAKTRLQVLDILAE